MHIQHVSSACTPSTKGPIPIAPSPQNATIQEYGGNVTFYCTGDFGCLTPADVPRVQWWVDNRTINDVITTEPRYHVTNNKE